MTTEPESPEDGIDRRRARTRVVYDRIAEHFSATRVSPWPEVEDFLEGRTGAVGLDVGCGNGRHAAVLADRVSRVLAVDLSRRLLGVTGEAVPEAELVQGDAAALGVATDAVDLAVYVATLHHLPDRRRRLASLAELNRVLAPGGTALISAWSSTHERFEDTDGEGFDTTVPWTLPDGETVPRFYHVYDPDEFERDLAASPLVVLETTVSSGNCYGTVRGGD